MQDGCQFTYETWSIWVILIYRLLLNSTMVTSQFIRQEGFSHPWPLTRFMSRTNQAISLSQSPAALRRWMVPGPDVVRMTTEFDVCIHKNTTSDERHHKQSRSSQVNFAQQVQGMVEVIEEMGNPFMEETKYLLEWTQQTLLIQL